LSKPKVGFIVPRCGAGVFGGAESYCFELARRLGQIWDIDVLTTCAQDYMTWKNVYPEGHSYENAVHLQRFPVDRPRDVARFNRLSERISFDVERSSISAQEAWMREQGPVSSALARYLAAHKFRYDAFFFFSYLYATTYLLLPEVQEKAFLVPFAHDEWPLRMRIWSEFFKRPQCIIFSSPEEHDFVQARFSRSGVDGPIIGASIPRALRHHRTVRALPGPDRSVKRLRRAGGRLRALPRAARAAGQTGACRRAPHGVCERRKRPRSRADR